MTIDKQDQSISKSVNLALKKETRFFAWTYFSYVKLQMENDYGSDYGRKTETQENSDCFC